MGLVNKVKSVVGGGDSDDDFDVSRDDVDDPGDGQDDDHDEEESREEDVDEEEEEQEFDTAYQLLDWALEERGFAGIQDFAPKAMMYACENSERYRDRLAVGQETIDMVTSSVEEISGMGRKGSSDPEAIADQLSSIKNLEEQMEDIGPSTEKQVTQGILQAVNKGIDNIGSGDSVSESDTSDVETETTFTEEEI